MAAPGLTGGALAADLPAPATISLADVRDAAARIQGAVLRTPTVPARPSAFFSVSLTSRFSTSPNSYGFPEPSASIPVAR